MLLIFIKFLQRKSGSLCPNILSLNLTFYLLNLWMYHSCSYLTSCVWVCVTLFFTCCCSFSSCCCFSCRTCSCCSADTIACDSDWRATWAAELRAVEASPTIPVDRPPTAGVTPNVLTGIKEEMWWKAQFFQLFENIHYGVWYYQPTNCEIRPPSQSFVVA